MLKKLEGLLIDRRIVGGVLLLLQAAAMIWLVSFLSWRWMWVYRICIIISAVMVIWLVRKYDNPAYKIPWIVLIYCFRFLVGSFICYGGIHHLIVRAHVIVRLYSIRIFLERRLCLQVKRCLLPCRVIHAARAILRMSLQCRFGQIRLQTIIRVEKSSLQQCVRR